MNGIGWLLFFYTVPSKPVNSRIRVWRRLMKAGAAPLRGVYCLPFSNEHFELFQWLTTEVASLKGEAAFVQVERIEGLSEGEVIECFTRQREKDCLTLEKSLEEAERRLMSLRSAGGPAKDKRLSDQVSRITREMREIRRLDFFSSPRAAALEERVTKLTAGMRELTGMKEVRPQAVAARKKEDYQNRRWVTRKNPFVDRMASAWLISKFIDPNAVFGFADEGDTKKEGELFFDTKDGDFTHIWDFCTFEVLVKSFSIRDRGVHKIGEIVHELDVQDDRYRNAEAKGVEEILRGIRKTAANDDETLRRGVEVFEMLYSSMT